MFSPIRSYKVHFLLPYRDDPNAIQDSVSDGMFHHVELMVGESEEVVIDQVLNRGGIPVSVALMRPRNPLFNNISGSYKEQFLKAIYFTCASMSASKALEAVIESETSAVRAQLNPALAIIKRGGSFMESLDSINVFDESCLAILEAGERTGTLKESINTAVEHLKSSAMLMKIMMGMGIVAVLELFMAFSSLLGNRFGLLPNLSKNPPENATPEQLEHFKNTLEYAYVTNDIMIVVSILVAVVGIVGAFAYFDKDKSFRLLVDKEVQKIPGLGETIRYGSMASSFRVAASLLKGGVHFHIAMKIAEKSTRNPSVNDYWSTAQRRHDNGEGMAACLKQSLLDNSNQLLVTSPINSKQLAEAFFVIAERSEDLAKRSAKKFAIILFFVMAAYSIAAVAISVYALFIQNESLMSGLSSQ